MNSKFWGNMAVMALIVGGALAGCGDDSATTPGESAGSNSAGAGGSEAGGSSAGGTNIGGSSTAGSSAGGSDAGGAAGSEASTAGELKGKLLVPGDFAGEATRVLIAAASKLPLAGPPDGGLLLQDNAPKITPGGTYEFKVDASILSGKYYVLAIVFVKGGGTLGPKAGMDYDVATAMPLEFDGKAALDTGPLTLALHQAGDGH